MQWKWKACCSKQAGWDQLYPQCMCYGLLETWHDIFNSLCLDSILTVFSNSYTTRTKAPMTGNQRTCYVTQTRGLMRGRLAHQWKCLPSAFQELGNTHFPRNTKCSQCLHATHRAWCLFIKTVVAIQSFPPIFLRYCSHTTRPSIPVPSNTEAHGNSASRGPQEETWQHRWATFQRNTTMWHWSVRSCLVMSAPIQNKDITYYAPLLMA